MLVPGFIGKLVFVGDVFVDACVEVVTTMGLLGIDGVPIAVLVFLLPNIDFNRDRLYYLISSLTFLLLFFVY